MTNNKKTLKPRKTIQAVKHNLGRLAAGAVIGGIVPAITWDVAHYQTTSNPLLWLAVAGGLAYSSPMVAGWFCQYVGFRKAWGFVVALETALTFTESSTAIPALTVLVWLNAWILSQRFANGIPSKAL